jgi:predicted nucleic acid-binding protein
LLLLDASVWVAAAIESNSAYAEAGAIAHGDLLVAALDLTLYEVANAIGRQYRLPAQARKLVQAILCTCGDHLVRVDQALVDEAAELVVSHNLSAYDAAYVAAARRHGWQLVSLDVRDLVSKGLAVTPDAADYP